VTGPTLGAVRERIEAAHPGHFPGALRAYALLEGLPPLDGDPALRDRGFCLSGPLWRRPGPDGTPDGTVEEHALLVIPEAGGVVPEKRHFRLLENPAEPGDPRLLIGDEQVTVLTGVLALVGEDVDGEVRLPAGTVTRSYGCRVDPARREIEWFQDRHALQAERPWTAMVFRQRLTTLAALRRLLGPTHPDLVELVGRGVSPAPGPAGPEPGPAPRPGAAG
jgi:hypothetical protein